MQCVLGPPGGGVGEDDGGRRQRICGIQRLATITHNIGGRSRRRLPFGGLGVPQDEAAGAPWGAEGEEGWVGLRAAVGLCDGVCG